MPGRDTASTTEASGPLSGLRLDSWKEIATYLKRSPRTVRRWERREGLPAHRHLHAKKGTIYAFAHEIDEWLRGRRISADRPRPQVTARPKLPSVTGRAPAPTAARPVVIAVLPLRSLGGRRMNKWLSVGLTDEIISILGQSRPERLRVIALTSSLAYRQSVKSVEQIGKELGADYVLEGAVQRIGRRIRLTARLVCAHDQAHVWTESFEIQLPPFFALQQDLARRVADAVSEKLGARHKEKPRAATSVVGSAYGAYLEGGGHFGCNRDGWSEGEIKKSIEYFSLATEKDGDFGAAYAELASAYFRLGLFYDYPPVATFGKVRELALKALSLDPKSVHGLVAMAAWNLLGAWRWAEAEANSRRAVELNPSDCPARGIRAACLLAVGDLNAANDVLQQAARIHHLCPGAFMATAVVGLWVGRFDEALKESLEAVRLDPSSVLAHAVASACLARKEDYAAAIRHAEKSRELSRGKAMPTSVLSAVYAMAGRRDSAERLFQELVQMAEREYVRSFWLARAAAGLGNLEAALEWLEKAFAQRDPLLVFLKVDPMFEPLSKSSGFRALLDRIGLWR
jgi:TolB-like protein/Flp pilus assembly protein TadD